ncbi:MAG: hypothetical protein U5N26_06775 [Candidatus Marinimicrobia bacterium]|nr:hypothetical protein [Candidatus Neomarinimicrobiota bacterium]
MPKPVFSREALIEKFSLNRVNKKAAVFDLRKLEWVNGQHLSKTDASMIWKHVRPLWKKRAGSEKTILTRKGSGALPC